MQLQTRNSFSSRLFLRSAVSVLIRVLPLVSAPLTAQFVYVANTGSHTISEYNTSPGGSPSLIGSATFPDSPYALAVDPVREVLYVAGGDAISSFGFDSGGMLSLIATVASSGPVSLAVDPKGAFLYAANDRANTVSTYRIESGGTLTPIAITPVCVRNAPAFSFDPCPMFGGPRSVAVDPSGTYLYAGIEIFIGDFQQSTNSVVAFKISSAGVPVPLGPPVDAGGGVIGVAQSSGLQPSGPNSLIVDPTGRYVYFAVGGVIAVFRIASDGTISRIGFADVPSFWSPISLAVDPTGTFVYAAAYGLVEALVPISQPGSALAGIRAYRVGSDGLLSPIGVFDAGRFLTAVTVDPSGKVLYVTASQGFSGENGRLLAFAIDPATGALAQIGGTIATGPTPSSVVVAHGRVGIGPPTDKEQCKKEGWRQFTIPRQFKNQGDCIQFVNTGR